MTATRGIERTPKFRRPGLGMGFASVEYSIALEGRTAVDFADIPEPRDAHGMSLYVSVGSLEPKELKYVEKTGACLQYRAWAAMTRQDVAVFTIWGEHANDQPKICFDGAGKGSLRLLVDVNTSKLAGAHYLEPSDFRVQVRGNRISDGKETLVFDTKMPCKI